MSFKFIQNWIKTLLTFEFTFNLIQIMFKGNWDFYPRSIKSLWEKTKYSQYQKLRTENAEVWKNTNSAKKYEKKLFSFKSILHWIAKPFTTIKRWEKLGIPNAYIYVPHQMMYTSNKEKRNIEKTKKEKTGSFDWKLSKLENRIVDHKYSFWW